MGLSPASLSPQLHSRLRKNRVKRPLPRAASGHSHFTKIPATVEEIWKEIDKQQGKLARLWRRKIWARRTITRFAIRDLVKALPAKVAAENKAKAEESAKEITKLAADIDKSGAARGAEGHGSEREKDGRGHQSP